MHADLHSFPTRRSSDLSFGASPPARSGARCVRIARTAAGGLKRAGLDTTSSLGRRLLGAIAPPRSEEHTPELQSRFDLVCRLLLEKKKKAYAKPCTHRH